MGDIENSFTEQDVLQHKLNEVWKEIYREACWIDRMKMIIRLYMEGLYKK